MSGPAENKPMTTEQRAMVESKLYTRKPESDPTVCTSNLLSFLQGCAEWANSNLSEARKRDDAAQVCWNRGYKYAMEEVAGWLNK